VVLVDVVVVDEVVVVLVVVDLTVVVVVGITQVAGIVGVVGAFAMAGVTATREPANTTQNVAAMPEEVAKRRPKRDFTLRTYLTLQCSSVQREPESSQMTHARRNFVSTLCSQAACA